jgi:hypothetical protein
VGKMLGEYDSSDEKLADSFGIHPPKLRVSNIIKMGFTNSSI